MSGVTIRTKAAELALRFNPYGVDWSGWTTPRTGSQPAPFVPPDLGGTISREAAWRIPAVAQGVQTITGAVSSFPVVVLGPDGQPAGAMTQFDPIDDAVPNYVTLGGLIEDLVFGPYAYLLVTSRFSTDGRPARMRWAPAQAVQPLEGAASSRTRPPGAFPSTVEAWSVGGVAVDAKDVIVIPSLWPGLLEVGSAVLTTAALLEAAAQRYATADVPLGMLKNNGADLAPLRVEELLEAWEVARRTRTTGYLNSALEYQPVNVPASEIALTEAREQSAADIARVLNLPARFVNAPSNDSLTYSTVESQRRDLSDITLRPYLSALEQRLSMPDVLPRGHRFELVQLDWLRSDTAARFDTYKTALESGVLSIDEVRRLEHLPPLDVDQAAPVPVPVPAVIEEVPAVPEVSPV